MIINTTQKPPQQQPPSREKLEIMLKNGESFVQVVIDLIEKFKLPYLVEMQLDGSGVLKNQFTAGEMHLQRFITEDPDTLQMKLRAQQSTPTQYEVLITGDTGTGKETIAKAMIGARTGAFKAINCAGMPEGLIESELFGHVRGAFTGAEGTKNGLITEAQDGVMFLDEVGELALPAQAKLLRAIQEKVIRKVGSVREESINCKFVFATHRDLKDMVIKGLFRKDLYARISTLELHINSLLPHRMCDLVPITKSLPDGEKFLQKYQVQLLSGILDLSLNVRSLQQHIIRNAVFGSIIIP